MTNHIHLIVNCNEPYKLSDTIRDFKRHVAKQILFQIRNEPESRREWMIKLFAEKGEQYKSNEKIKFWKTGNHAIELFTEKFVWDKINYIHENPVKEEFVAKPEDWKFSSASNYYNEKGILNEVICLTPILRTYD